MWNQRSSAFAILSVAVLSILSVGLVGQPALSASLYWDGITGSWTLVGNWSTDPNNPTPDPSAVPGAADSATFNISTVNGPETIDLGANQSISALIFNNTGTTTLQGGGSNRTLTLGTGGITVNSGAGAVTIGSATGGQQVPIAISGSQTWTNNSANTLAIKNNFTAPLTAILTLTFDGTGNITFEGTINTSPGPGTNTLNIVKNGTSTVQVGTAAGLTKNLNHGTLAVNTGTFNIGQNDLLNVAGLTGSGTVGNGTANNGTIFLTNGTNSVFSGAMQDGGAGRLGLNKSGMGTLSLTGSTTYTERTTVNGGTIEYGSTSLTGSARTVSTGAVAPGLSFAAGDGAVKSSSDGTGNAILTFGISESRTAGATANFIVDGGTNGTTNSILLTKAAGFIDQGTYFGGDNYAVMDGLNTFVRALVYGTDAGAVTSGAAASLAGTAHQEFTGAISAQTTATFTTLKNNGNNDFTLDTGATVTTNGILKTGNVAGGATISGGTGIQAAAGAEMVVRTVGANDALTISTPILANGASSLTKSGAGTLTLSAVNTYTGATTHTNGTLNMSGTLGTGAVQVAGGVMNLSGTLGANATTGAFRVGTIAGTPAVMNVLPGASATTRLNLFVGDAGAGNGGGAVYQSGGTITLTEAAGNSSLSIGSGAGGYGYYSLSGGSISASRPHIGGVNQDTIGVMDITGGTLTSTERIEVNSGGGGSAALLNVKSGTVNAGTDVRLLQGGGGGGNQAVQIAVLNVGGGGTAATVTTANSATQGLVLAQSGGVAGKQGIANLLPNGTLTTGRVTGVQANNTAHFNFHGGTLKATATNAGVIFNDANIDAINVYSGGGTIDNSATNITIDKPLRAPAGFGVTSASIAVPSGGAGYIGAPFVRFSGGTGTGATGYATVSGGVVTGITMTSPGIGYTSGDLLTASFFGGGATTQATNVTNIAVAANAVSGGLTFTGTGITILSGAGHDYGGATNVNQGTLRVNGTKTGSGLVSVASGATLGGSGTIAGNISIASGGNLAPGASIGTLTMTGNVTIDSNGFFQVGYNSTAQTIDLASISGTLNINGGTINFADEGAGTLTQSTYVFATFQPGGTLSYTATNIPLGYSVELINGNSLALVVPEASAFLAVGLVGLLCGGFSTLRRRRA